VSLGIALNFAAPFYRFRRDRERVQEVEDARLALATEHGSDSFLRLELGDVYRGWLASEAGRGEEAIAQIRGALEGYRAVGAALGIPTFLETLAEVCGKAGRPDEGLAAVAEAVALAEQTGMHYWDAELHRVKGELLLRSERSAREAESCFLAAIEIARRQQATSFELRSATSLSRLWQRQGKIGEARALLAEVFGWFNEGFATADLVDAKALLDELTAVPRRLRR
jgi:predicted ATPase